MKNFKKTKPREGWSEEFKKYAEEGEDEMLLPDYLDSETLDDEDFMEIQNP